MGQHIIHSILERAAERKSHIYFMNRKGEYRAYSYSDMWNQIKNYAHYFEKNGVKARDKVTLVLPTSEEYLNAFFGAQLIKAIPVSIYPPSFITNMLEWTDESQRMVNSVESKFLITNSQLAPRCKNLAQVCEASVLVAENVEEFNGNFNEVIETLNKDDICFFQFSSGTNGPSKAVMISQENALLNAREIANGLPPKNEDISVCSWLPLYHDMGLVGCLLMSIVNGNDLVLIRPDDFILKPELWLKAIHDFKINSTTAPNFAYGLIAKRVSPEVVEKLDLSSMQAFLCGAEMVYEQTIQSFIKHLAPAKLNPKSVLPVYGMAETTLAVTFTDPEEGIKFFRANPDKLKEKIIEEDLQGTPIACVGKTLESFEVKIVDDNEEKLQEKRVGRILVKSPCVTKGYYNNQMANLDLFIDEWLDTGDQGFLFNNELYICGRVKDIIIVRGRNFFPSFFEDKIYKVSGIRKGRAIVSSLYNENLDTEEVIVLAEADSKKSLEEKKQEIISEIEKTLKQSNLPIGAIEILAPGSLKKTSSGKLKRRYNVECWRNGTLKPSKQITKAEIYRAHLSNTFKKAINRFISH